MKLFNNLTTDEIKNNNSTGSWLFTSSFIFCGVFFHNKYWRHIYLVSYFFVALLVMCLVILLSIFKRKKSIENK
jgi:membrane protein DedA with SNARE-associated domain